MALTFSKARADRPVYLSSSPTVVPLSLQFSGLSERKKSQLHFLDILALNLLPFPTSGLFFLDLISIASKDVQSVYTTSYVRLIQIRKSPPRIYLKFHLSSNP